MPNDTIPNNIEEVNTKLSSIVAKTTKINLDQLMCMISVSGVLKRFEANREYQSVLLLSKDVEKVLSQMWSHIVWKECIRKSANFESAQCIVLDIDNEDGYLAIDDAHKMLEEQELLYILAPTASHQCDINKSGQACEKKDKYRILLFLDKPITDQKMYTKFYSYICDLFPGSDKAAKDCARVWAPPINPHKKNKTEIKYIYGQKTKLGYTVNHGNVCTIATENKINNNLSKKSVEQQGSINVTTERGGSYSAILRRLATASYTPGTSRNNRSFHDGMWWRFIGMKNESDVVETISSKSIFDANFTPEKLETNIKNLFTYQVNNVKRTKKLSADTLKEWEVIKKRVVAKILSMPAMENNAKDDDLFNKHDQKDIDDAVILYHENTVYVKTPRRKVRSFKPCSGYARAMFVKCTMERTKSGSYVKDDAEHQLKIDLRPVEENVSLYTMFKNKKFLQHCVDIVWGETYYPVSDTVFDDCVNTYVVPSYLDKNDEYNDDVKLFKDILNTVVNNNEFYYKWMCNWVNHLLLHPDKPLTRHPVILAPQGACKGTFFTILEGLLGGNTLSIKGEDILGKDAKFNSVICTENVLICMDELRMTDAMVPEFKRLFKNNHNSKYEKKGIQCFKAERISNFLILGNVEERVLRGLKADERSIYPIKWEDHEFIQDSKKFEAAQKLFEKLDAKITTISANSYKKERKHISKQFVSNVYHYLISQGYDKEILNTPMSIEQKVAAFEDNLDIREIELISFISAKRRVCFKTEELLAKPVNFYELRYETQNEINARNKNINIISKKGRLNEVLRLAGYVQIKPRETSRVWVLKEIAHVPPATLRKWLDNRMTYDRQDSVCGGYLIIVDSQTFTFDKNVKSKDKDVESKNYLGVNDDKKENN